MEVKRALLTRLLDSVKCSQSKFGSRSELATEDDPSVQQLCKAYEDVFLHGFLKKVSTGSNSRIGGIWSVTESLVPNSLWSTEIPNFWPLIKSQLSKHEAERFLLLHNVRTDLGRSRAWLRASLNEHSLERYILIFLSLDNLHLFYDSNAFLRDEELSSILPQTAAGLGSVLFALSVDNPELDKNNSEIYQKTSMMEEPAIAESLPELAEVADLVLNPQPNKSHGIKKAKKKKKIPTTLVSFDDPGHGPPSSGSSSVEHESHSKMKIQAVANLTPNVPKILTPVTKATSPTITIPSPIIEKSTTIDRDPEPPQLSADCISTYSDCSERLEISNLEITGTSPSERLKPVQSDENSGDANTGGAPDKNNDLIPVPNYAGYEEDHQHQHQQPMEDGEFHDSVSIGNNSYANLNFDGISLASGSLGLGDDRDRVTKLRTILDHEIEVVSSLKAQLAEEKRKYNDHYRILETRIETLTKENELLKHQLKKYIGAVQLLRNSDGNHRRMSMSMSVEEDSLVDLDGLGFVQESNSGAGAESANEAAEYERKLIQVAEMHGELMEFNAHLQNILKKKDVAIRRLREELVDLRGPLSSTSLLENEDDNGMGSSFENIDSSSTEYSRNRTGTGTSNRGQGLLRQSSINERVLINIWVPSAFLTGATNDLHHVYQVFIRIKDTEWNVYRRYSEFYNLHKELKKNDAVISNFYFPPKKHIGNKDIKFVDERRRKLQEYLRNLINHILKTNSILASHPDKNLLISILPFFGEINHPKPKRSRSRSRKNLFFRASGANNSNSPGTGLSESVPSSTYAQYTGL